VVVPASGGRASRSTKADLEQRRQSRRPSDRGRSWGRATGGRRRNCRVDSAPPRPKPPISRFPGALLLGTIRLGGFEKRCPIASYRGLSGRKVTVTASNLRRQVVLYHVLLFEILVIELLRRPVHTVARCYRSSRLLPFLRAQDDRVHTSGSARYCEKDAGCRNAHRWPTCRLRT
jgi:hypothetical protein